MPNVYLSPSHQEANPFIIGGNEEYYMNLIVDAMIPSLRANDIDFTRNNPDMTLSQIIDQSNAGNYDLHMALAGNRSPDDIRGSLQGPDVYYYTASVKGKKAAEITADHLKKIYPNPDLVAAIPNTPIAELRRPHATAVLVGIGYLDNFEDASWIRDNINVIAKALADSIVDFLRVQ